jgi:hypothetical protein
MHTPRWPRPLGLLTLLLAGAAAFAGENHPVSVKVVKYDGLAEVVRQHRGRVVVVDFWSDY